MAKVQGTCEEEPWRGATEQALGLRKDLLRTLMGYRGPPMAALTNARLPMAMGKAGSHTKQTPAANSNHLHFPRFLCTTSCRFVVHIDTRCTSHSTVAAPT